MLTPAELAAQLRVSERTVARMVNDGCPSFLVGARRRFDLAAVTAWAEERGKPCRSAEIKPAGGTRRSVSDAGAFIDAYRKVQLRVTPSVSKRS
jgi:excisionase family DNA binding protein